jgi:PAB1-binding protein PBP1
LSERFERHSLGVALSAATEADGGRDQAAAAAVQAAMKRAAKDVSPQRRGAQGKAVLQFSTSMKLVNRYESRKSVSLSLSFSYLSNRFYYHDRNGGG